MPDATRHRFLARPAAARRPAGQTARIGLADVDLTVACRTRGAWEAFELLGRRGASPRELARVAASGGAAATREWSALLRLLTRYGAVGERLLDAEGRELFSAVPLRRDAPPIPGSARVRGRVVLSRFAHLRRDGRAWTLQSPLAPWRVQVAPAALALLAPLEAPQTPASLARAAGTDPSFAAHVVAFLAACGLLTRVRADGATAEDADPALRQWEFADLVLQGRHRTGMHDEAIGAAFPFLGEMPPEPATVGGRGRRTLVLPRPAPRPDEPSFAAVVEARRSVRDYGRAAVSLAEVSELLWRSARVRPTPPDHRGRRYEVTSRPSPSGGGCHALEIVVTVGRCRGLPRGLYHYDPVAHALSALGPHRALVSDLLATARAAQGRAAQGRAAQGRAAQGRAAQGRAGGGQVLLTFVARFRRVTWKYRAIALATILKDVGALTQTLYLTATAMGLAPCAIGSGDATRLSRLLGWRYPEAAAVGDFMLGTRDAPPRPPRAPARGRPGSSRAGATARPPRTTAARGGPTAPATGDAASPARMQRRPRGRGDRRPSP